jgi:hypothetical protein
VNNGGLIPNKGTTSAGALHALDHVIATDSNH